MNVQDQIAKLESLLDRIRRNAGRPRAAAVRAVVEAVREEAPHSALPATARGDLSPPPAAAFAPAEAELDLEVTVAAETSEFEELDMMDEEIVEIDGGKAATASRADLEADLNGASDELIPESAPRPAAQAHAQEIEPPLKTPPPESGRQFVAPSPTVSYQPEAEEAELGGVSDVDALLEADMSGSPISKAPPGAVPTMEQLGETVELEGADASTAGLELIAAPEIEEEQAPMDELELSLPKKQFGGGFDQDLAPPAHATEDLARRERAIAAEAAPAPSSALTMSGASPSVVGSMPVPTQAGPIVVERPALAAVPVLEVVPAQPAKLPETFLELLDASLRLRA